MVYLRFAPILILIVGQTPQTVQGLSKKTEKAPATAAAEPRMVAYIERALFDYSDHVERVAAMRETFGKDPSVSLRFLDYGFPRFEQNYRNWCTVKSECPLSGYATAPDEVKIPDDKLSGKLWHMDSAMWALRQAISSNATEWVLMGQDMLFVNRHNLWSYLDKLDHAKPLVLGNRLKGFGGPNATAVSGWSYILSRAAAVAFSESWDACSKKVAAEEYLSANGGNVDYGFGFCLGDVAEFIDTRDSKGLDRFMLWPPSRIDKDDWWDSWYPSLRKDAPVKTISPGVVSFFFAGAKEIRALNKFEEFRGPLDTFVSNAGHGSDAVVKMFSLPTWKALEGMRMTT